LWILPGDKIVIELKRISSQQPLVVAPRQIDEAIDKCHLHQGDFRERKKQFSECRSNQGKWGEKTASVAKTRMCLLNLGTAGWTRNSDQVTKNARKEVSVEAGWTRQLKQCLGVGLTHHQDHHE
jgi:hypothetical protein